MPALDRYHEAVARSLVRDGWTITKSPLTLTLGGRSVFIDLGAERLLAAERGTQKIAVEIKTFGSQSPVSDIEEAIGQFGLYEDVLGIVEPERTLYLAIPAPIFETVFQEELGQMVLKNRLRRVIVFSVEPEEITQWIPLL